MSVGAGEIKIGFDIFSKLMGWASGRRKNKQLEELNSRAFQELLKGDSADLVKVSAAIRKLRKEGDCSTETERLEKLFNQIPISKKSGKVIVKGFGTFDVIKRKALMGRNPLTGKEIRITARKMKKSPGRRSIKK